MSIISINTTQNVHIDFVAASAGERILAFIIDMAIKLAYVFIVLKGFDILGVMNQGMSDLNAQAVILLALFPFIFYTLIFESLMGGQTIGKRLMKIKVIKIDGFEASLPDHFMRWIFRITDILLLSGILALLFVILNPRNQRLGDIVAGTTVISLKQRNMLHQTVLMELQDSYEPKYPAAAYLSDKDARIIKRNYEVAMMSNDYNVLSKLRERLVQVLQIQVPITDDAQFISDVLRDFNYYTKSY